MNDSLESAREHTGSAQVQPDTTTERTITEWVRGLLKGHEVGRAENLFLVGGHSLMAAQLLAKVKEGFAVKLTLRQLFAAPTIAELAALVDRERA
jgi:aryl carrier-like protein